MRTTPFLLVVAAALGGCADPCGQVGDICTMAGVPNIAQFSADGLPATESPLYLPVDGTVGPDGLFYILDFNNHRIRRIESDDTVHTIAGTGFLGDGPPGDGKVFAFNHPTGLAFHPERDHELYIAAWHNSRINVVDTTTGMVEFRCGTGGRAFGGDGGPAMEAVLDLPSAVAFDDQANLYISDQANQIVRKVDPEGIITTVAGLQRQEGYQGDGGPALEAKFHAAVGQAADPSSRLVWHDGVLYLADTGNHVVRTIDTETWTVGTFAGEGEVAGSDGDGGAAIDGHFSSPRDLAVDDDGTVYVADTDNHCVRAIAPDGTLSTVAGVCGQPGFEGDGAPANEALLFRPFGVDVTDGVLRIADTHNHVFRQVLLR